MAIEIIITVKGGAIQKIECDCHFPVEVLVIDEDVQDDDLLEQKNIEANAIREMYPMREVDF